ncbi:hypothetical protein DRJ48_05210 [Candidatus Woesearchaeota archaeon]|nr:MAG: hypothetical protein DRJ48_05210 [Candidatus Woesearchaeota archaeon]
MTEVVVPPPDTSLPRVLDKFDAPTFMVRFKGVVDFDALYNMVCKWLRYRKFQVYETTHKYKPPEIEVVLDCRRKKTGYKRDRVKVHFHMFKNRDVEVMKGDKIVKMMEVRMTIRFSCYVETGYANYFGWNRWRTSKLTMVLQNILNRYILRKEIDSVDADALYYELYDLQKKVKDFLKMEAHGGAY